VHVDAIDIKICMPRPTLKPCAMYAIETNLPYNKNYETHLPWILNYNWMVLWTS